MTKNKRYPQIKIRSKNELAKHLSGKKLLFEEALKLINDVIQNYDSYWKDSNSSEPKKNKYVRSAINTPLGKLLKLIDRKILAPHDNKIPEFIFGGIKGRNHIDASYSLLGKRRKRVLYKTDLKRFFEQISINRVSYFFHKKCGCSKKASELLANLCCVKLGSKGTQETDKVLTRGFSTSPRLAVWCNLDIFLRLSWRIKKILRGHDPRLAIYVDDIGVTGSRIDKDKIKSLANNIKNILLNFDANQELKINERKTGWKKFNKGVEHLGVELGRNKLGLGGKTKAKFHKVNLLLKKGNRSDKILRIKKGLSVYKNQLKKLAPLM